MSNPFAWSPGPACTFPRCECMCRPEECVFLEKNRKKFKDGKTPQRPSTETDN